MTAAPLRRALKGRDLVGIIEAAYRIDLDEGIWIQGVTEAAAPLLDAGNGVAGYLVDTMGEGAAVHSPVMVGERDPWDGEWRQAWWEARVERMPRALVAALAGFGSPVYASQSCGALAAGARVAREAGAFAPAPLPPGVCEALVVSCLDVSGQGAVLFAFREEAAREPPSREVRARWERLSAHLAAAIRLRHRRSASAGPMPKSHSTVEGLDRASRAIDQARSGVARSSDHALELWPVLHRGRYSIVPMVGGAEPYQAIENRPRIKPFDVLTPREQTAPTRWASPRPR
jgi:hypothetical protein